MVGNPIVGLPIVGPPIIGLPIVGDATMKGPLSGEEHADSARGLGVSPGVKPRLFTAYRTAAAISSSSSSSLSLLLRGESTYG